MIELHYRPDHKPSNDLLEKIDEMVLAVKRVSVDESPYPAKELPLLIENGKVYSSAEEIQGLLDELNGQLKVERTVSGDSCYINPATGEKC